MGVLTTAMPFSALTGLIQDLSDATERATAKAMVEATELAYNAAVRNAKANFNNTPGRVRTGQLTNSIYRGYDPEKMEGFIATRAPQARILELGGDVHPVYAKHLWVKFYDGVDSKFRRWMPRDFMAAKQVDKKHFFIFKNPHTGKLIAAYRASGGRPGQIQALFVLRDAVTLKSRPYMEPAAREAYAKLGSLIEKHLAEEMA